MSTRRRPIYFIDYEVTTGTAVTARTVAVRAASEVEARKAGFFKLSEAGCGQITAAKIVGMRMAKLSPRRAS